MDKPSEIYKVIFENTGTAMVIVEEDTSISMVNREFERVTGYSEADVKGKSWTGLVHPGDVERMKQYHRSRRIDPSSAPRQYEFRIVDREGQLRHALVTVAIIPGTGRSIASCLDITDLRRAQEALKESEERYRTLVESSRDAILMLDSQRRIVTYNSAFEELFGYEKGELKGKSVRVLHPSEESYRSFGEAAYPEIERSGAFRAEWHLRKKDGSTFPAETVTSAIRRGDGTVRGYVAIIRDISERKRLEDQLHRIQTLEALGQLAGGIAHDFGNVLTSISGFVEMALRKVPKGDPLRRYLEPIRKSSLGAAQLVRKLLLFGRQQPFQRVPLDLNPLVEETVEVLDRLLGEDISVILRLEPRLWPIEGDPGTLKQVLTNLLLNARDAMPEGGEIVITTENVRVKADYCKAHKEAQPGDFVRLSVKDTGLGMDKEVMDRVFEPFFTTKEAGRGSGLGLSVVYGVVKEHGGWINVRSAPKRGSLFEVYLPATPSAAARQEEGKTPVELEGRGERVLLVEDEEGVREFASEALRGHGYQVFAAPGTEEALALFEREGGEFHVLFSDVVLPDGSGLRLAEELQRRRPGLKVILTSGYIGDRVKGESVRQMGFPLLQKPYSLLELLKVVKEVLKDR